MGHRARRRGVQMCFGLVVLVALAVIFVVLLGAAPRGSSANWSFGPFAGYVWRGQVTSVQGSWSVPRVSAGSSLRSAASTWIGAEAPGEPAPFIQIGTNEQRVSPAEVLERGPGYYAFWSDTKGAFHPRPFFRVSPGDDIRASLALARKRWTLASSIRHPAHRHTSPLATRRMRGHSTRPHGRRRTSPTDKPASFRHTRDSASPAFAT